MTTTRGLIYWRTRKPKIGSIWQSCHQKVTEIAASWATVVAAFIAVVAGLIAYFQIHYSRESQREATDPSGQLQRCS